MRTGIVVLALSTALAIGAPGAVAATTTSTLPANPTEQARALVQASALRAMKQNWAGAEESARAAIALDRTLADGWHHLGIALAKQGRTAEATAAWEEALLRDPDHTAALEGLGRLYAATGKRNEAEALLDRLRPLDDRRAGTLRHAIELGGSPADRKR